ncbi:MAG: peptidase S24 [Chlamydiae bacterium RIFCSPHIGHO2_12_FULL_27_8]|nr:MAG: peptidase S24 [Chlamydiae bacterium RIFCSPHIGHO2_12_FULL_27_8]
MNKKLKIFNLEKKSNLKLPIYLNTISAGFPSPADDFVEKKIDLNEELVKNPAATFFVKVDGDSMIDANIFKDDILIVDRSIEVKNNKIVLAVINGEFTVKRLKIFKDKILLKPENPKYNDIEITKEMDFEIWGTISFIIHKAF